MDREAQKHVEMLPGTEIMTDIEGELFFHAQNSVNSAVLVPQPSKESHDPLNWSKVWKYGVVINQGAFVLTSIITNLSIAPLTPTYIAEFHRPVSQIALLTGATVLALGYANFVIIPCSDVFGRRIVTLVCSLICLGSNIWQATASSYDSFLGARILNGLGAAANESIMTVVVADIFFLHQRGKYIGIYFCCYFVGTFIGPIIAGSIAENTTWRWFFWACTMAQAVNFLSLFFLFPETRRNEFEQARATHLNISSPIAASESDEIATSEKTSRVEQRSLRPLTYSIAVDDVLDAGRPSISQFKLLQPADRRAMRQVLRHIVTPIQIFTFPIVFWAAMSMGAAANCLLDINLTQSQVLSAPPYHFRPASVGYANFALVVGGLVGMLVAGPWSDWVSMRATKKNGGIREAEMRLPALLPFIAAAAIGMTVVGVGYQNKWPWEAIIIVGFGLVGLQGIAIPTLTITYAIDSYKPIAGQIMVIATVCKNTFGFGMTYFINDWAEKAGFVPPLMLLGAMSVGFSLLGVVFFMRYGKQMRRLTKDAVVHTF